MIPHSGHQASSRSEDPSKRAPNRPDSTNRAAEKIQCWQTSDPQGEELSRLQLDESPAGSTGQFRAIGRMPGFC
jgi:hypothetical protein